MRKIDFRKSEDIRLRQRDVGWNDYTSVYNHIEIIGCGGIGSWVAFALSRAGFSTSIWDDDKVETHNIGGQFFSVDHIDKYKIDCIADVIDKYSNSYPVLNKKKFDESAPYSGNNIIIGTDNITSRKIATEKMYNYYLLTKQHEQLNNLNNLDVFKDLGGGNRYNQYRDNLKYKKPFLIDARMQAEYFEIFCLQSEADLKWHLDNNFFAENEVEEGSCTYRQTTHIAMLLGGLITNMVTNHFINKERKFRVLERHVKYDAITMKIWKQ